MSPHHVSQVFGFLPGFLESTYCDNASKNLTFTCNDTTPPCSSPERLEFNTLWNITTKYYGLCGPTGKWFYPTTTDFESVALTRKAAEAIVGTTKTPFHKADIISRLTTWKFPLIQLLATVPRPPFGGWVQALTVLHLASDPISSIEDLLYKLDGCQRRAVFWQKLIRDRDIKMQNVPPEREKFEDKKTWLEAREMWMDRRKGWRMNLTIISESYSELGMDISQQAERSMQFYFIS